MPELVTITEREYKSLRAAAELVRHPEALVHTILANRPEARLLDLEDAFPDESVVESAHSLETKVLRVEQKETSEY